MNKIAILMGTPGAGKTTVMDSLKGKHNTVNVGSEMLSAAIAEGMVKDRDELRYLSPKAIVELRLKAFRNINRMDGPVIIDTHATVKRGSRYVPGFSIKELQELEGLKAFIYIDASAKEIAERRKRDATRRREDESREEIDQHRSVNIAFISAFASYFGIPIYIIKNKENKLDETLKELETVASEIFG